MLRVATAEIQGKTYRLLYTCEMMFAIQEEYGANALDNLGNTGSRDSLAACIGIFKMLAEEAETVRRKAGYDPGPMPDEIDMRLLTPRDWVEMKNAIFKAATYGYTQEIETGEEVDLILLENQKKNPKPLFRAKFLNFALRLGMQPSEMYRLTPGQFSDLVTLRNQEVKKYEH